MLKVDQVLCRSPCASGVLDFALVNFACDLASLVGSLNPNLNLAGASVDGGQPLIIADIIPELGAYLISCLHP